MNANLRSDNISLQFEFDAFGGYDFVGELWQTLRRTAVEAGQSSLSDYTSFADECLLCARIVTNEPGTASTENQDESLWGPEEPMHNPSSPSVTPDQPSPCAKTVGLIYLHAGPANLPCGEANVGVITKQDAQRRGYAREALQLVLCWAFEELKFHRIQAAILDTPFKDRALRLFIGSGFTHEGTRRRAVYQPEGEGVAGVWKDVTYLAMLDTEWVVKSTWVRANGFVHPPVASVWDEMFSRHAREREELAHWEEKHGRMRRTSSTETLRERTRKAMQDMAYLTDDASSVSTSSPPSPRPNIVMTLEDEDMADDEFNPGEPSHERWEEVIETSLAARQQRQRLRTSSLGPSLQGHMLALPSIPSIRLSEFNAPSPLTIPTPSTPGAPSPPFSLSPSPAPSSPHSDWSSAEDEHNQLLQEDPFATPHVVPGPGLSSVPVRSRSSSVSSSASSSSTDSWSDAQSSVGASSSSWDALSDVSDHSPPWHA